METAEILLYVALIVILLLLFLLFLPAIKRRRSRIKDHSLEIKTIPHPFAFEADPRNPLNDAIVDAVNRMGGVGDDAERFYQDSINALRKNETAVIPIVLSEYKDLSEDRYLDRWSLVQLLAELSSPLSLVALDEIIESQIPAERFKDPSNFSSVGEEVIIRTTAVEAVTRIAAKANPEALGILLKHARHANFSVKRACIQGYLAHGGADARDKLLRAIAESDRRILDIRREDVRRIPQPTAGKYVRRPDSHDTPRIPPPYKPIRSR